MSFMPLVPTTTIGRADPGVGTTVTAAGVIGRRVNGYAVVTPNTITDQLFDFQLETGVGTGVYSTVVRVGVSANAANVAAQHRFGFSQEVATGRRYKYAQNAGTPTLGAWSDVET